MFFGTSVKFIYTGCFGVEVRDFSQWLGNTYRVYVGMFAYHLSLRGWYTLIKKCDSILYKFFKRLQLENKNRQRFEIYSRRKEILSKLSRVISFCPNSVGKQVVDKKMWKKCTKNFNFQNFCQIIKIIFPITQKLNWYYP